MLAVSALTLSFATPSPRTLASFDDDWKFHRGDASGASDPKFDDGAWRTLDVPHDWSSEDLPPRAADVLTVRNGTWKFHRGDDAQWSSPAFDDSAWERVRVPSDWRVASNYTAKDAVGWYRRSFDATDAQVAAASLKLALGAVAKQDTTYLNGQQIGASGSEKANCGDYLHFRSYDVPAGLLKPSANVLAVRVFSEGGNVADGFPGGLYDHPTIANGDRRVGAYDAALSEGGRSTGYTVGGVGWYRKHFPTPSTLGAGGRATLIFDGVYMNSTLWLNGKQVATQPYGYSTFHIDVTDHLLMNGGATNNVLAVRVANGGRNSRWYSGSGIFRHVHLLTTGRCTSRRGASRSRRRPSAPTPPPSPSPSPWSTRRRRRPRRRRPRPPHPPLRRRRPRGRRTRPARPRRRGRRELLGDAHAGAAGAVGPGEPAPPPRSRHRRDGAARGGGRRSGGGRGGGGGGGLGRRAVWGAVNRLERVGRVRPQQPVDQTARRVRPPRQRPAGLGDGGARRGAAGRAAEGERLQRDPHLAQPGEPRVPRRVRPFGCVGDGRGVRLLESRQERRRLPHLLRPMVAPRPGGDGDARPQPPVGGDLVDWERDPDPQHPARLQPIRAALLVRPRARPAEAAGDVGVPGRRRQGRSLLRAPRYRGVQLLAAAVRVRPRAPPRPRDGRDRIVPRRVVHVLVQRVEPLVRRRRLHLDRARLHRRVGDRQPRAGADGASGRRRRRPARVVLHRRGMVVPYVQLRRPRHRGLQEATGDGAAATTTTTTCT